MGCIIGFSVYALGIIYAIIMIVIDMRKRDRMYADHIEEDLDTMNKLGMDALGQTI